MMIGILCISILSAIIMGFLVKYVDGRKTSGEEVLLDRAARREQGGQRGFAGFWRSRS